MQSAAQLTKLTATVATLLVAACAAERTNFDSNDAPVASTTDSAPSASTVDPEGVGDEPSSSRTAESPEAGGDTDEGKAEDDGNDGDDEANSTDSENSVDEDPGTDAVDSDTGDTSDEDVESDGTDTSVDDDPDDHTDTSTDVEEESCAKVGGCGGETPVCDNGNGRCVACVKDDVTCTDSGDLATCTPDGEWEEEPCSSDTPYCVDAKCLTCDPSDPSTCEVDLCEGVVCTASDECHTVGVCDPGTGMCTNPTATNGHACDDGDECTQSDTCQAGQCVGASPVVCPASDECHDVGVCDPATGTCSNPTADEDQSCDDGDPCTEDDSCGSGACEGSPILCDDPPACKESTSCSSGACNYSQNVDDGTLDAKCASGTQYCSSGTCVECTTDAQCSGSTPSCRPHDKTCVCRLPSSGNLLVNPGFDGSFTGWESYANCGLTTDSEQCAESKAAKIASNCQPKQCVQIPAGGYDGKVGGRFKADAGVGAPYYFVIRLYSDQGCSTLVDEVAASGGGSATANWVTNTSTVDIPSGVNSVEVEAWGDNVLADQLFFGTSGQY